MDETAALTGNAAHPFRDGLLQRKVTVSTGETVVIAGGTWLSKGYFPYFTPGLL